MGGGSLTCLAMGTARSGEELSAAAARGRESGDDDRRAPGAGWREIGRAATGVMARRGGGAGDVGKASGVDGGAAVTITGWRAGWGKAGWGKAGGGGVSIGPDEERRRGGGNGGRANNQRIFAIFQLFFLLAVVLKTRALPYF
jgi:hypothetical protein